MKKFDAEDSLLQAAFWITMAMGIGPIILAMEAFRQAVVLGLISAAVYAL